jgi:hypothetical protein
MDAKIKQKQAYISDCYKMFKHFAERNDNRDEKFWEDVVNAEVAMVKKHSHCEFYSEVMFETINEIVRVKDKDKEAAGKVVYYNIYLDCGNLLSIWELGFEKCNKESMIKWKKYKGFSFASRMLEVTMREISRLLDENSEEDDE